MKNNKKCPKCNRVNIVCFSGKPGIINRDLGITNSFYISPLLQPVKDIYVCRDCGYTEEWIRDKDLETINVHIDTDEDFSAVV